MDYDHIWYHLGGYDENGDTTATQAWAVEQALEEFWLDLAGPHESLRMALKKALGTLEKDWQTVNISSDGTLLVNYVDGSSLVA